jgi:hypothetical protein
MEKENKTKNTGRSYLSLIGGAIALLAFFAPWAGCNRGRDFWGSAGPPPKIAGPSEMTGADLASDKPEFYIALVAALIIVIVFLIFMFRKQLGLSRWPIIISSIGGIVFLIAEYINLQNQEIAELVTLRWGAFATLIGFLVALIGAPFLKSIKSKVLSIIAMLFLFTTACNQNSGNSAAGKNESLKKQNVLSVGDLESDQNFISNNKESLFFVENDTIYIISIVKDPYEKRPSTKIFYKPFNWDKYILEFYPNENLEQNSDISYFRTYISFGNFILLTYGESVISDGEDIKKILLVSCSSESYWNSDAAGRRVKRYKISDVKYPALYYSYNNRKIKLKNGFEASVKNFVFIYEELFSRGIPISVSTRDSVDFKFGEVVYEDKMVQVGKTKEIRLNDADYLCFGSDGLIEYLKDFNKDINYSEYPFIFYTVNKQKSKTDE